MESIMSYKYSFQDNETYGVDDVNRITGRLMTAGIPVFQEGSSYTASDFNALTEQIAEAGIVNDGNSCKVSKGTGNQLVIQSGEAIFSDGSAISIDNSHTLTAISGSLNYVYFKKDIILGTAYPTVSTTAPTSADIPLAEYNPSTGALNDKRVYSVSKINSFGSNTYNEKVLFSTSVTANGGGSNQKIGNLPGMKRNDYKFITIRDNSDKKRFAGYAYYTENEKKYWSVYSDGHFTSNHMGYTDFIINVVTEDKATAQYLKLERVQGNEFNIYLISYGTPTPLTIDVEFNFS